MNAHSDPAQSPAAVVAHARVSPESNLALLSQTEVAALCDRPTRALIELFRRCVLAVLSSGADIDDARTLLQRYHDFDVTLAQEDRGLRLDLTNAPAHAFVDGEIIHGMREHLFAVLRDIVYISQELEQGAQFDLRSAAGITDAVFKILRHAGLLRASCPSSNKWDRCLVLLRAYFAHHFHVTQRVVDSANDVSR